MSINIENLAARVERAAAVAKSVSNDRTMRDIAFCGAGTLSAGARRRMHGWRQALDTNSTRSIAAQLVLSVARGEVQERTEIQRKFLMLSTPVEQAKHADLIAGHPDSMPAGDFALMLRIAMAKFDKRLAARLPITIEMGARTVTLNPAP